MQSGPENGRTRIAPFVGPLERAGTYPRGTKIPDHDEQAVARPILSSSFVVLFQRRKTKEIEWSECLSPRLFGIDFGAYCCRAERH